MPYYYEIREVRSNNGCGFGLLLVLILVVAYLSGAFSDDSYDSYDSYDSGGITPSEETGDLGIAGSPISNVDCDESNLLIIHSALDPSSYRSEVVAALSAGQGAKYLRTDQSCSSFEQSSTQGDPIYAVYLGPFDTSAGALAECPAGPSDAYVKELDPAGGPVQRCPQ